MARNVYLVDTENVGQAWKYLLEKVTGNDKIILFYTEKTPHLSYTDLAQIQKLCDRFEMEKCYTGNNALDFQLVSYLGFQLKSNAKTNFFIVSNDTGYDSVIQYWKDKERVIVRIKGSELVPIPEEEKEIPKAQEKEQKPKQEKSKQNPKPVENKVSEKK